MPRWLEHGRQRGTALDRRWALRLHRDTARPALRGVLVAASVLGDATAWLLLALLLPLADTAHGLQVTRQMLALGSVNLLLYGLLKHGTRRDRPYCQCEGIQPCMAAADRFSFPSGHTLHAVAFAALLSAWYPWLAGPLAVFATLVGLSRVALGLHYPSDVLAGALIGLGTARAALDLFFAPPWSAW